MTHHATLIIGTLETHAAYLPEAVRRPGADVRQVVTARFSIDEARELTREAALRPIAAPERTFVLSFAAATLEAQNALLKTLEEPVPTSRFFVFVPREDVLIPTLRSRLVLADVEVGVVADSSAAFLRDGYAGRLTEIAARAKAKDDMWFARVLDGIEIWAHAHPRSEILRDILLVRQNLPAPGSSKKMLFEHLSLSLPTKW